MTIGSRWLERWRQLPPLPGGAKLWVTLASAGFLLAALLGHGRQFTTHLIRPEHRAR